MVFPQTHKFFKLFISIVVEWYLIAYFKIDEGKYILNLCLLTLIHLFSGCTNLSFLFSLKLIYLNDNIE